MSHIWVVMSHVMSSHVTCVRICDWPVGGKEVSLQEIRSWFEFVSGLFGIVLRGGYLYGAWPRTVRILIEFEFIVPELWQLVVFCTCQILPEGLKFVENFRPRMRLTYVTWLPICLIWVTYVSYKSHRSSHVTYEYQWVMPHDSKRPDAFICVTWLTHVTLCVTWLTHVTHMNDSLMSHTWMNHVAFIHVTRLTHVVFIYTWNDRTHSYVKYRPYMTKLARIWHGPEIQIFNSKSW